MSAHATLGASGAHRWMRCLGQPNYVRRLAERGLISPDGESSVYAEEGSAAHFLAERCIGLNEPASHFAGWYISRSKKDKSFVLHVGATGEGEFEVTDDMVEAVQVYLDTIAAERKRLPVAEVLTELRVYPIAGAEEEMFGTADVVLWDLVACELVVMDYKHGAGIVVEAEHNVQTMFYGLGALRRIAGDAAVEAVEKVKLVIVQPRARHADGPVRVFELTARELVEWGGTLRSAAEATKDPNAPLVAGDWCRFCPAAGPCTALRRQMVEITRADFDDPVPAEIPAARIAAMLPDPDDADALGRAVNIVPLVDLWCREVEAMALRRLEHGRPVDGYKLVRKRSTRRWTDPASVEAALRKKGVKVADIYDRKLRSPAQIEKIVGKDWVKEHAEKPEGGLTIARDTDPRDAVAPPVLALLTEEPPLAITAKAGDVTQKAGDGTTTDDRWLELL